MKTLKREVTIEVQNKFKDGVSGVHGLSNPASTFNNYPIGASSHLVPGRGSYQQVEMATLKGTVLSYRCYRRSAQINTAFSVTLILCQFLVC